MRGCPKALPRRKRLPSMQLDTSEMAARRGPKVRLIGLRHLDNRTRSSRRARALVAEFSAALAARYGEGLPPAVAIAVERAATLIVLAEDTRARRLAGDFSITLDDTIRVDRCAA